MLRLVKLMPPDQVSVRDLCAAANLSHPTFYRSHSSKEEILREIAAKEAKQLNQRMESIADQRNPRAASQIICGYVQANRAIWTTLLTSSARSVLCDEWSRLIDIQARGRQQINPDFPLEMSSAFVVTAMIEILGWWLRQPEDYPRQNVEQFLERLVLNPTIGRETFVLDKQDLNTGTSIDDGDSA